jgi:hypothetical protein
MSRNMTIVEEYPPNFADLVAAGFVPGAGAIFTYGDTLYNPDKVPLSGALIAHESTHAQQQFDMGRDEWWEKWKLEPAFRAEQEACGYGAQYAHFCKQNKDRNARARYLFAIEGHLLSEMYKLSGLTRADARAAILKRAK